LSFALLVFGVGHGIGGGLTLLSDQPNIQNQRMLDLARESHCPTSWTNTWFVIVVASDKRAEDGMTRAVPQVPHIRMHLGDQGMVMSNSRVMSPMKPGLMFYSFLYPAVVDCLAYNESSRL
jgi:hypothetical protein